MNKSEQKNLYDISNTLSAALNQLQRAFDNETEKLDNIPENLQGSQLYQSIERSSDYLMDAIEALGEAINCISLAMERD